MMVIDSRYMRVLQFLAHQAFFPEAILKETSHRFTYPKGVHSYRYFLQPMRTPNSLSPAHAYSPILLLASHAYMQLHLYAYTMVYALAVELQFSGKMHEQITKEFEGRKYLYECAPFGYVNL